jgi:hypothetical protein
VIAGSLGAAAGELLASLAGLEELAFERSVFVPQFVFTDDAQALLLTAQLLRERRHQRTAFMSSFFDNHGAGGGTSCSELEHQWMVLSDHPKPASDYHLKTGQRE